MIRYYKDIGVCKNSASYDKTVRGVIELIADTETRGKILPLPLKACGNKQKKLFFFFFFFFFFVISTHSICFRIEQELMARILSEIAENRSLQSAKGQDRPTAAQNIHVHVEPDEVSEITEDSASAHHDSLLGKK